MPCGSELSRIVVVGAGIAGLAVATRLAPKHDVVVFEREPFAGGMIRSQKVDGYLFEWGPSGFLSSAAELRALVHEAGLDDALTEAGPAASSRFIFWNGALHELPSKPPRLLRTSLLSGLGKLRVFGEFFIRAPSAQAAEREESVYGFFERRFGREVAERIASPALLGISGGDAAATSVAALFPQLENLEREHGSVLRGMMRRHKPGRLRCFGADGMARLTERLAHKLGDRVRLERSVESIEPLASGWRVRYAGGELAADIVVVTTPSDAAATLVEDFDAELARLLRSITYVPMRVVGIAFRAQDVPVSLAGFGFLAARGQGVRILGAVYTSTIAPEQAPAGVRYLRVFLGGATDPEAASLGAASARAVVRADLATTLAIEAEPIAYHEVTWPRAIPQYSLGHRALLRQIDKRLATHQGLALAGNAYRGLGLADIARDALAVANRIA